MGQPFKVEGIQNIYGTTFQSRMQATHGSPTTVLNRSNNKNRKTKLQQTS